MINRFVRVFRKNIDEFQTYDAQEKMEILFEIINNETLLNKVIEEIKEDEIDGNGNIFINLLSLMPFSIKIVERFLKSKFLDDNSAYSKLKIILKTRNGLFDVLQQYKIMLRNENLKSIDLDEKIRELDKELAKHKGIAKKIEEYERKISELKKVENLTNRDVNIIKKEYEELKSSIEEIKRLKKEIEESKKVFKNLPKDES